MTVEIFYIFWLAKFGFAVSIQTALEFQVAIILVIVTCAKNKHSMAEMIFIYGYIKLIKSQNGILELKLDFNLLITLVVIVTACYEFLFDVDQAFWRIVKYKIICSTTIATSRILTFWYRFISYRLVMSIDLKIKSIF